MQKPAELELEDILYVTNTFPKAFFVWGILEKGKLQPHEMEEKLELYNPNLSTFSFLERENFNQYCKRSLSGIVDVEWVKDERNNDIPAYSLKKSLWDIPIQDYAAFILTKSMELGVDPQDYLSVGGNSSKKAIKATMDILLHLYGKSKDDVANISAISGLDCTSTSRHMERLEEAGLVERTTYEEERFGYEWKSDKSMRDLDLNKPSVVGIGSNAVYKVALQLSTGCKTGPGNLVKFTGYTSCTVRKAISELVRQGLITKLSKGQYSQNYITDLGKTVAGEILMPLQEAWKGRLKLSIEPTDEQLIEAMEMYKARL